MLIIKDVQYSKNHVKINEAFLFQVTVIEEIALWSDLSAKTWGTIKANTWDKVKLKYF